ncbi:hypothetical protein [Croceicoccus naphthovorans]|uniref:hypothetical protein n=1 Tax=Croceicoccus naphthovorans TaxID=1348774 RepID=UPI000AE93251|nr:hypothetical protein [Croceicoccus naphthovorans]MBB3988783.1 hypothetical protein [Croceicoccus naphthovorans]
MVPPLAGRSSGIGTIASMRRRWPVTNVFGPSPADIWPDANRRLYRDPLARRVQVRDHFVVPRRLVYAVIVLALIGAILVAILG